MSALLTAIVFAPACGSTDPAGASADSAGATAGDKGLSDAPAKGNENSAERGNGGSRDSNDAACTNCGPAVTWTQPVATPRDAAVPLGDLTQPGSRSHVSAATGDDTTASPYFWDEQSLAALLAEASRTRRRVVA